MRVVDLRDRPDPAGSGKFSGTKHSAQPATPIAEALTMHSHNVRDCEQRASEP
jgi:hypothetical protein